MLNTDRALTIIISIFLSVAIAFVFGLVVQWISRLVFTFHFRKNLGKKIGIYGGFATTAIIYFMLIKGLKGSALVAFLPENIKHLIFEETMMFLLGAFVFFTLLMQILHWLKVNVLKVVVLMGTFSLAMAFAGNDLVNFIGVTLAGLESFNTFVASGGNTGLEMGSLNDPATTSVLFLIGAGAVMVFSLFTSKKEDRKAPNKKISMMRRWMVRDDGKVDLGLWKASDKKKLILPLDVHVYAQATALGLTSRRQKDIVTAQEITDAFREIWPEDPCMGDFALFGYGVNNR